MLSVYGQIMWNEKKDCPFFVNNIQRYEQGAVNNAFEKKTANRLHD